MSKHAGERIRVRTYMCMFGACVLAMFYACVFVVYVVSVICDAYVHGK